MPAFRRYPLLNGRLPLIDAIMTAWTMGPLIRSVQHQLSIAWYIFDHAVATFHKGRYLLGRLSTIDLDSSMGAMMDLAYRYWFTQVVEVLHAHSYYIGPGLPFNPEAR